MIRHIAALGLTGLLLNGPAHAQDSPESRARLSSLDGVYIYVEPMTPEMDERGVTADVLHAHVERTLRQSDIPIFTPDENGAFDPLKPTLYVNVTYLLEPGIEQCVYSIRVELLQSVKLERSEVSAPFQAVTWSTGGLGYVKSGWRQALIEDVVGFVGVFKDAYFDTSAAVDARYSPKSPE